MNTKAQNEPPEISVTSKDGTMLALEEHLKKIEGPTPAQINVVRMDEIKSKSWKPCSKVYYNDDLKQESLDQSGYVKTYTRKEIMMENLARIRKDNLEKYGKRIENHILDQVLAYIGRDQSKGARSHQQKTTCVLLGLTMGPVNVIELTDRLNSPIRNRIDPAVFQFEKDDISNIIYRLSNADPTKSWLRKYLIIHPSETSKMSSYELPPPMMLTAAINPIHLLEGFSTLDGGFTEEQLLNQLPILEEMVDIDDVEVPSESVNESDEFSDHFAAIRQQFTDWWKGADNITITDIAIGFLMQGKFYSIKRLTDDMLEWMIEMHKSYPNVTKKVTKITGLAQTIRTWLSPEYPIHHFIEIRKKSKRYNEYRIRPELSQLLWRDVVCLKKKANTDKLKKLCRANDWLNEIVNPPEKLTTKSPKKEQSVPLTESPKKEQSVPLEESNLKTKSSNQEPSDQTSDIPDVLKKVVEVLKGNNLQDIFDNGIDIHISFGNSKSNNLDSKIDDVNARLDAIAAEVAAIAKVWK